MNTKEEEFRQLDSKKLLLHLEAGNIVIGKLRETKEEISSELVCELDTIRKILLKRFSIK